MSDPLSDAALDTLFRSARTYNSWQDVEVTEVQIRAIYELTKMGPTSANACPARFVWLKKGGDGHKRLIPHLAQANQAKSTEAPWVVIMAQDLNFPDKMGHLFPHNPGAANWFNDPEVRRETMFRNATLQAGYLIAAVRALGLDCGAMSGFDAGKVKSEFFGPNTGEMASWEPNFIMNIGYGSDEGLFPRSPRLDFEDACRLL